MHNGPAMCRKQNNKDTPSLSVRARRNNLKVKEKYLRNSRIGQPRKTSDSDKILWEKLPPEGVVFFFVLGLLLQRVGLEAY